MSLALVAPPAPETHRLALHPGQAKVFTDHHRFRVVVAGRRWGKTHLARVQLIAWALRQPGRYWYIAPTRVDAKDIFWDDLKSAVHPSWMAEPASETELSITFTNGSTIKLLGADDPDSLVGRGLRGVVLDEFADMKIEAWTRGIRPALSDYRAPALFIGTPKAFNHFYDLFQWGLDPNRPIWSAHQFKQIDNPFIDPLEAEAAKEDLDERTWRQEYEASFEAVSGRAYYAFSRLHHVAPLELVPDLPVCLFFDFNVDPATAGIGQRVGDAAHVLRVTRLTHRGGEATRANALAVRTALESMRHHGQVRIYGDATGRSAKTTGPADHAVVREVFPGSIWCIPSANPHERDRVAAVNRVCETMAGGRRLKVSDHPSCASLIADLEQVIIAENGELDKKTNPMLTHISDALGYWLVRDFPPASVTRAGDDRIEWLL